MSTESIQNPSKTLSKHYESYGVSMTLINGGAGAIQQGQEVFISANNSVDKRTGAQFPIGVCSGGAAAGDKLTVRMNVICDSLAIAKGGAIAAGAFVKPNGSINSDGIPEYVACTNGDFANAIVLKGGNVDTELRILILRSVHTVGAVSSGTSGSSGSSGSSGASGSSGSSGSSGTSGT